MSLSLPMPMSQSSGLLTRFEKVHNGSHTLFNMFHQNALLFLLTTQNCISARLHVPFVPKELWSCDSDQLKSYVAVHLPLAV